MILPLGFEDSNLAYKLVEILTREVFPTQVETDELVFDGSGTLEFEFCLVEAELFNMNHLDFLDKEGVYKLTWRVV